MNARIELEGSGARVRTFGRRVMEAVGIGALFGLVLSGCADQIGEAADGGGSSTEATDAPEIHFGAEVALGDGTARTFLTLDGDVPVEVGIALSESAMASLPADGASGGMVMPDGHSTFGFVLPMPSVNPTPFRHVGLDWNPVGHEPPGTYDLPHFDFHFYLIDEHERHAMDPSDPQFLARGERAPEPGRIPEGYLLMPGGVVPLMGAHWVRSDAPELRPTNPEPFSQAFIYGSWDGRLTFVEPMVTRALIEERTTRRFPVSIAESYELDGFYPASYEIRWSEGTGEYQVALTDLAWRE